MLTHLNELQFATYISQEISNVDKFGSSDEDDDDDDISFTTAPSDPPPPPPSPLNTTRSSSTTSPATALETGGGGFEEIEEVDEFAEDVDVGSTFLMSMRGFAAEGVLGEGLD